jgi:Flp pilus assembly protein TadG
MLRRLPPARRAGTATVELALVMLFIVFPLILGLWEMGRYVQVQQVVANSAREGARMAAQAVTVKADGTTTQIFRDIAPPNSSKTPNVKAAVMQYLAGAGLTRLRHQDVDVTFEFLPQQAGDPPYAPGSTPGPTGVNVGQPYQGIQNQRFRVTVTITDESAPGVLKAVGSRPLRERVLWTTLGFVQPNAVGYQADWVMMVDLPFSVNATVPGW